MTEIFPEARPDAGERQGEAAHPGGFGPAPQDDNSVAHPGEALRRSVALPDEPGSADPALAHLVFGVSRREPKHPTELWRQDAVPQARPAEPALPVEEERPDAAQLAQHPLALWQLPEQWLPEQHRASPQLGREQEDVR